MNWTSGYVAEIDYTHGYYRELAPGLIDFALLMSGHARPGRDGSRRYLELGFGQGLSVNIHAAACPGEFWGTDFNPSHAGNAQAMAAISQSGAQFGDDSFAELAARDDLPEFEYIVLHGIWSWVSDENRRHMVDIIRRRLRVGGAVYMSYNTLPGWAMAMPLRHMMTLHAETAGSDAQGVVGRIDSSLAFGAKLAEVGARYFTANPMAKGRLDAIAGQNRHYLAHEYFNRDWAPMYFSDAHEWLSDAKLSYAAAAGVMDQMDGFNLTAAQRELLSGLPHTTLRETTRDYLVNQQFRRDLFTRGAQRLSGLERVERLNATRVTLVASDLKTPLTVDTGLGQISLKDEIYAPVLEALANHTGAPRTIGEIAEDPKMAALPAGALLESIAVLVGSGRAHPVQAEADIEIASPRTARLNAHLIERARVSSDITTLASPVLGAGVGVGRFEMLFLGARAKGKKSPADWAKEAWSILSKQNQSIIKNGEMLKTAEANLEELTTQAKTLNDTRLSMLKALRVAD